MNKDKIENIVREVIDSEYKKVIPKSDVRELVELLVRDCASKADLASAKTEIVEKIHEELKPFREMRGELRILKRFFYIGAGIALALLFKMAFAPDLFTYASSSSSPQIKIEETTNE